MDAIAEDIEKKTRGTTAVNKRLRKISPNGLRMAVLWPKNSPANTPDMIPAIRNVIGFI